MSAKGNCKSGNKKGGKEEKSYWYLLCNLLCAVGCFASGTFKIPRNTAPVTNTIGGEREP